MNSGTVFVITMLPYTFSIKMSQNAIMSDYG